MHCGELSSFLSTDAFYFFANKKEKRRRDRANESGRERERESLATFFVAFSIEVRLVSSIMWILRFVRLSPKGRSFYQRKGVTLKTSAF